MQWTVQQQEAIDKRGSDILVSAAAGSGKTAVLTERIKKLIIEEGVSVENMLIVTFTNAAAAEMKEKIIKALRKAAEENESDSNYLKKQIRLASTADISTFHKFSMNVIRRFFYLTGVDGKFNICDEGRAEIMLERCLDEMIEERFEQKDEKLKEFFDCYSTLRSDENARRIIRSVYSFIMSLPDPFEWLDRSVEQLSADAEGFRSSRIYAVMRDQWKKEAERAYRHTLRSYEAVCDLPSLETKARSDLDIIEMLVNDIDDLDEDELAERTDIKWATFRAGKDDKEDYDAVRETVKHHREAAKTPLKKLSSLLKEVSMDEAVGRIQKTYPHALYIRELVYDLHERFTAAKREQSLMDFNDVEHEALAILRHEEAAEEYRKLFNVIFIDEYQDSSMLQEAIIACISRGGNVFMVGDIKQSIYKFRLAEPSIFIDKYHSFSQGDSGHRIDLNRNFRSKKAVINVVNGVFGSVMNMETGGIEYDEAASLIKGAEIDGEPAGRASIHLIDGKKTEDPDLDEEIADLKNAEIEAKIAAEIAAERVGTEIFDSKTGRFRKAGFGDIVILMRGVRGKADLFTKALRDQGIPAYVDDSDGYFMTNEIDVFMNLLRVIDNRRQDIPLISVLRSPVFGFSVDELADIRLRHRTGPYSTAFLELAASAGADLTDDLAFKCAEVNEKLDLWRNDARYMRLQDLIQYLMHETGYLNYVSAMPGGDRRAANLKTLVDKAVDFSESQTTGLFGFIRYAEAVSKNKLRVSQYGDPGDSRDMVRIMTIHKSKGLEFPIVIVSDLSRGFRMDSGSADIILHKDYGIGMKYSVPEKGVSAKTLPQQFIKKISDMESIAEEMRILYVAMTRAMDELILTGVVKDLDKSMDAVENGIFTAPEDARCFMDWILPNIDAAGLELHTYTRASITAERKTAEEQSEELRREMEAGFPSFTDSRGLIGMINDRFAYTYPYMRYVLTKSKYTATELNAVLRGSLAPERGTKQVVMKGSEDERQAEEAELERLSRIYEEYAYDQPDLYGNEAPRDIEPDMSGNEAPRDIEPDMSGNEAPQVPEPDESFAVPEFMKGTEEISAAARGTLVHKVLELIEYNENNDEDAVRAFVKTLAEKGIMTENEAAAVDCGMIAGFFRSDIGRRACRADGLRREWHFTLRKSSAELAEMACDRETAETVRNDLPPELLIQGVIDCCFSDGEGIVILDFKTDRTNSYDRRHGYKRFIERYWRQLSLYREVVEKATGENVEKMSLFMLKDGAEVVVEKQ